MGLKEKIQDDANKALKEKDRQKLSALRMLLSELHNVEIKKQEKLEEDEVIQIIAKQVKKWEEAALEYEKAGQSEKAEKEKFDAEVLRVYLPEQLSEEELKNIVEQAIEESGASSMREMGQVMKLVMPKVKGRADGKQVNQMVQSILASRE